MTKSGDYTNYTLGAHKPGPKIRFPRWRRLKAKGKRFGRRVKPGHKPSRTTLWRRARTLKS